MSERVIYPQLSGLNWPGNVLQVWLTLHQLGVPPENLRFLPEMGHFAAPEVVPESISEDPEAHSADILLRHPRSPHYAGRTGRAMFDLVDPTEIRPRFKVNVRTDTRWRMAPGAEQEGSPTPMTVGRLAHFVAPLLALLPEVPPEIDKPIDEDTIDSPLMRLTRQICARYPELMESIGTTDENPLDRFKQDQLRLERSKIVRELVEILTSEAFTSVAMIDYLWGLEWAHGPLASLQCPAGVESSPGAPPLDGLLLSLTGGCSHRTLLVSLLRGWAERDGFLGVGSAEAADTGEQMGRQDRPALQKWSDEELLELWSLVSWRREAPDPVALLETAAKRLIHAEVLVKMQRYSGVAGGYNTLLAQAGATAVLGGKAALLYPGVAITMPLNEDADEAAVLAKERLKTLLRLFLPICLRVEIIWREALGYLGRATYLQHGFQAGVRLAPSDMAAVGTSVDEQPEGEPLLPL